MRLGTKSCMECCRRKVQTKTPARHVWPMRQTASLMFTVATSYLEPGLIARSALWLALCVQQTPRSVLSILSLSYAQNELVNLYMRIAKSLLELEGESGGTIDGIESMNMLYKLSINMGRPHQRELTDFQAFSGARHLISPYESYTTR